MARERNKGPLRTEEILRLFREIMSACLAQEEPLKVGFLGPEGTFSQTATLKHFGHSVRALALASVDEVFHEVEAGLADFGVVPVENSTEGAVNHTLDLLLGSPLKICGEVELRIHQFLMGAHGSPRQDQAHLQPSAVAGAVPRLARRAPAATCSASRSAAMPRARAARATRRARPPSPAKRPPSLRPEAAGHRDRRPRRQHHALFRRGPQGLQARPATTAPPSSARRCTPNRRARCSGCWSRWRSTRSA